MTVLGESHLSGESTAGPSQPRISRLTHETLKIILFNLPRTITENEIFRHVNSTYKYIIHLQPAVYKLNTCVMRNLPSAFNKT